MPNQKTKFFIVLAAVILIPAFLAPLIYPLLKQWFPFERILSRLVMIFAFIGIAFLIGKDKLVFQRYGYTADKRWLHWLAWGFFLGVATILAIEVFETLLGAFQVGIRVKANRIPERIFKAFFTALLIGSTEEFFFRGFVFLSLTKLMGTKKSLLLTNAFYAIVHFFRGAKQEWLAPTVLDSFRVLANWFTVFVKWQDIVPQFLGLMFFGCILNYAFIKTRSLYLPVGLHAGAVFFLKVDVMFFGATGEYPVWLYGGRDFYSGIYGWIFLTGLFLILYFRLRKNASPALA